MEQAKPPSALAFVLKAMIPYSRQNLMLGLAPNRFFNELEKVSSHKRQALEQAARRAIEQGLIEKAKDRSLRLTELGRRAALPYVAEHLPQNGRLMVIFDIPENLATSRKQLRRLLKKWGFEQVQKSVWLTSYDHRESVSLAVDELELQSFVELYECFALPIK